MIETIYGMQDETKLRRVIGIQDNEVASIPFVEYYNDKDELVHRSATINVKHGYSIMPVNGNFAGA
jgi:hypothetical protein